MSSQARSVLTLSFLFYLGAQPGLLGRGPPTLGRVMCFTPSIKSNLIPLGNTPNRHTQRQCVASFLGLP